MRRAEIAGPVSQIEDLGIKLPPTTLTPVSEGLSQVLIEGNSPNRQVTVWMNLMGALEDVFFHEEARRKLGLHTLATLSVQAINNADDNRREILHQWRRRENEKRNYA